MEKTKRYYLIVETNDGQKQRVKLENLKIVTTKAGGNYCLSDIDKLTHQYNDASELMNKIKEVNNTEIINVYISTKTVDQFLKPIPIIDASTPLPFTSKQIYDLLLNNHEFVLSRNYGRCAEKWCHSYKSFWDDASDRNGEYFYQKLQAKQVSENYLLCRDFTLTYFAEQKDNDKYLFASQVNANGLMMNPPMYINAPLMTSLEQPVLVKESATEGQLTKSHTRTRNINTDQGRLF